MIGFPSILSTKEDFLNTMEYLKNSGEKHERQQFIGLMENIRDNVYKKVLKNESIDKPVEEQTAEDYKNVYDEACLKERLGFTDEEIKKIIKEVKG